MPGDAGRPGWEAQFATNHLGHFALVNRIWPLVQPGGRVVAVSSSGHRRSGIRWDDVMFEREAYDKWNAYGQAKTATPSSPWSSTAVDESLAFGLSRSTRAAS